MMVVLVTASCLLASCNKTDRPASTAPVQSVSLQDVQPLFGGRNVWVGAPGSVIVQVVERGQKEKRYELTLAPGALADLERLLAKHEFPKIKLKELPGQPDEARPTISITTSDGNSIGVAKWAGDKHEGFDAVYAWLLDLEKRAKKGGKLVYEGKFDPTWRPDNGP